MYGAMQIIIKEFTCINIVISSQKIVEMALCITIINNLL